MANYTTLVRSICEEKAGLNKSVGFNQIDSVLSQSWNQIFTTQATIFDESYREIICKKLLKHYYMREIGCETVGLWMLWMNERMEMLLPYYNKLWEAELLQFNPFDDVNLTRQHNRQLNEDKNGEINEDRNTSGNGTNQTKNSGENTRHSIANDVSRDLYSDTPQGALTGVENENYLTNARKITVDKDDTITDKLGTQTDTTTSYKDNIKGNITSTDNTEANEQYLETVKGKQGNASYSELIMKYRDSLVNVDKMFINEFADLFMGVW